MEIRVNGVDRAVPDGSTVTELLAVLGIAAAGVAVAVDGVLVPRPEHGRTVLPDGSSVEVLTAVQGG
ncbi:MAG: sulfur carrier protein ThiS [Labedaea sp.]